MHNSCYTKSCLDAVLCIQHPLNKCEPKLITKTMKVSFLNLIQLRCLSLFFRQCDKWEIIPRGDEIFLPSLSPLLLSSFLCSASSLNPPLSHASHFPFSTLLFCFIHHPALDFLLIYFFVLCSQNQPPPLNHPHISGSQLIYYLLKMSRTIKIHDCATHYVFSYSTPTSLPPNRRLEV